MNSKRRSKKENKPKVVVILGPTSSGKSALAIELARKFNGEVISADSRQVYKGFDLTSGKVTKREMRGVRHHLLGVSSPRSVFSVTRFQRLGEKALCGILRRGKLPIICGGTGLYIDALIYDYKFPEAKLNRELRKELEKLSTEDLVKRLKKLNERRAETIDKNNRVRLIRAIEISEQSDVPMPDLKEVFKKNTRYKVLKIGLNPPREELQQRIQKRILSRLRAGMINEVRDLRKNLSDARLESFGLEYRWITRFLRGDVSKKEMIGNLERDHRKYVKRQLTWWRKDKKIKWIEDPKQVIGLVENFL